MACSFSTSMMIILRTIPSMSRALSLSKPYYLGLESLWISVFQKSTMERFDIVGRLVSIR